MTVRQGRGSGRGALENRRRQAKWTLLLQRSVEAEDSHGRRAWYQLALNRLAGLEFQEAKARKAGRVFNAEHAGPLVRFDFQMMVARPGDPCEGDSSV